MMESIVTGALAFTATNIDDLAVLMLLFAQCRHRWQRRNVVVGQYLGFAVLILLSLPGFWGAQVIAKPWLGWLGLLPIAIGFKAGFDNDLDDETGPVVNWSGGKSRWGLSAQVWQVAAITIANGGDNLGIYLPLFASQDGWALSGILVTFFGLVGVWCWAALWIAQHPKIEPMLQAYGQRLVPIVLIGLGLYIWLENQAWQVLLKP